MKALAKQAAARLTAIEFVDFPRIIRRKHEHDPKGMGLGPSRFSSTSSGFRVLYAAQAFPTALAEAVIRDRFENRERRYIGRSTLSAKSVTLISTTSALALLDARADAAYALGIDTNAVRAKTHEPGQVFSEWLHNEFDCDGLLYESRLTGGLCVAVYDRAVSKLEASTAVPLLEHGDLLPELHKRNVVVRKL